VSCGRTAAGEEPNFADGRALTLRRHLGVVAARGSGAPLRVAEAVRVRSAWSPPRLTIPAAQSDGLHRARRSPATYAQSLTGGQGSVLLMPVTVLRTPRSEVAVS
jgi:hypothetical protein